MSGTMNAPIAALPQQLWPAGAKAQGILARAPAHGRPYRAELGVMPLYEPREYMNAADFENASPAPILVCPSQRYALLAGLVREAREAIEGLSIMVIRLCGADFKVQLPADLLAADVFLTHDPDYLAPALARSGRTGAMLIWHSLRTDGYESGDNQIAMTMLGAESVPSFLRFFQENEILGALSDVSVTTWGCEPAVAQPARP